MILTNSENVKKPMNSQQKNKNIKKPKLVTIVGTRPEIIKLAEVIKKADKYFEQILVHTGQNYDYTLNQVFFDDLELRKPDYFLETAGNNQDLGDTMGEVIAKSYKLLKELNPDALLVLGDTNSCLSVIPAKRLKIPIFHMEAGNRCFDLNVPEEINRKIVDHISDINLAYTEHARRYLIKEGLKPEHIMVTGSPMPEVISAQKDKINNSNILAKLSLTKNNYFILSTHREENVDSEASYNKLINSVNCIAEYYNKPIIFSVHPRTQAWLDKRKTKLHQLIKISKPFGLLDYIKLQQNAYCVISDSGTLSEESSILNFPAVLIRTSTERPESLDTGGMVIGGLDGESVINSINLAVDSHNMENPDRIPDSYIDCNTSTKVVKIIQGYISIVNEFVWRKNKANTLSAFHETETECSSL